MELQASREEQYLIDNGWKRVGEHKGEGVWQDPRGVTNGQPREKIIRLPSKEQGQTIEHKQLIYPPIPWKYITHQAVSMQQTRDAEVKKVS